MENKKVFRGRRPPLDIIHNINLFQGGAWETNGILNWQDPQGHPKDWYVILKTENKFYVAVKVASFGLIMDKNEFWI